VTSAVTLPAQAFSVSEARRHVVATLEDWGVADAGWTSVQLVSELATNAVIHARSEFTVELSRHGDRLRVCVRDSSTLQPGMRRYSEDSTTGRGLRLVDSLADEWGVERLGLGKIIWFEIDLATRATAQAWDDGEEIDLDSFLDSVDADGDAGAVTASVAAYPAAQAARRSTPTLQDAA
jgi:anti-sigma regulatory factor (Ser/Thr protein kinase)